MTPAYTHSARILSVRLQLIGRSIMFIVYLCVCFRYMLLITAEISVTSYDRNLVVKFPIYFFFSSVVARNEIHIISKLKSADNLK